MAWAVRKVNFRAISLVPMAGPSRRARARKKYLDGSIGVAPIMEFHQNEWVLWLL
jgi:hypothetical protein